MSTDAMFQRLIAGGALLLFPMLVFHRLKAHTREPLDRRQEGLFVLATLRPIALAAFAGVVAYLVSPRSMAWAAAPFPVWLRWSGVAIGAAGGMLLFWAVHTLGPNLTDTVVTRRNHTLVTSGPYQWVRHPFYGGVSMWMLANGLAAANWFILATGTTAILLFVLRTAAEEERLVSRFGDGYRSYMAHTGRFLPGIGMARRQA